jgi:hypothetical protein
MIWLGNINDCRSAVRFWQCSHGGWGVLVAGASLPYLRIVTWDARPGLLICLALEVGYPPVSRVGSARCRKWATARFGMWD